MEIINDSSLRVRADGDKFMPTPPPVHGTGADGGSIFDKLIEDYGALAERADDMVLQHVCGEIEMELRAHFFRYVQGVFFFFLFSNRRSNTNLSPSYVPFVQQPP